MEYLYGGGWYHWRENDNLLDYLDIIFDEKEYIKNHREHKSNNEAYKWFMTDEIFEYFRDRKNPFYLDKDNKHNLRFINGDKYSPICEIYVNMKDVENLNCQVGVPCSVGYQCVGSFDCNKKHFIRELEVLFYSSE